MNTIDKTNLSFLWNKIKAYVRGNIESLPTFTEEEISNICDFDGDIDGHIIPIATKDTLGCVIAGDGIEVDENGKISTSIGNISLESKMDSTNPTGTGSFSLNRLADSDIGDCSFTTGENNTASGTNTVAEGYHTIASGMNSHAEGYETYAYGLCSHAEGDNTKAGGGCGHAEGLETTTSETAAHAEGYKTVASGPYSHAEGNQTTASKQGSHAEGNLTTASGINSHAEGSSTKATGEDSHAEGSLSTASGLISHAEGVNTTASGEGSHSEGKNTEASGLYSHAEGYETTASEDYSHAEGWTSTASGKASHAEGDEATASGYASHAEGMGTIATGEAQHVQGKFNIADMGNSYAHIVGGGNLNTPKNIHTLDWSGNAWFAGNTFTDGAFVAGSEKTNSSDGKNGVIINGTGNIHIQAGGSPSIRFYNNNEGTQKGMIYVDSDQQMNFNDSIKYKFDNLIESEGSVISKWSFYTGGRTAIGEAKEGIIVGNNGHIYMTGVEPSLRFYGNTGSSVSGQLWWMSSPATGLATSGSMIIGASSQDGLSTASIGAFWKDGAHHYALQKYNNGLNCAVGWAGSSDYASVTFLRGQSIRLGSASGTTITSDERLKKDFTSLAEWDQFFDALEPCAFRLKNGNGGRFHMGFKAQQIEQALLDSGKTTKDFAGFVKTTYVFDEDDDPHTIEAYEEAGIKDGEDEYGLIYTEFTALNTYQIQKLKAENKELKERIEKLEQTLNL